MSKELKCSHRWTELSRRPTIGNQYEVEYQCIDCLLKIKKVYYNNKHEVKKNEN